MTPPRRISVSGQSYIVHDPREAVLDRLGEAYERFALREQTLRGEGKVAEAEGAHRYALWILRAYEAESRP